MRVPLAREGYPFIAAAAVPTVGLWLAFVTWGGDPLMLIAAVLSVATIAVTAFFRDPERDGPKGPGLVLAPGDGKVIDVADADEEDSYIGGPAQRISIFLSLFDVHVNRYPISGNVEHRTYEAGRFEPAWRRSASRTNERASTGIRGEDGGILVRQIAGLAAKRIVTYAEVGDSVRRGDRMGLIRFGSRVDVYLPLSARIKVSVGQRAVGGVTVIAQLPSAAEASE